VKQIFNFSENEKNEKIIRETWDSFRYDLANKFFRYDDIDAALDTVFLKVFNDIFSHGYKWLEKELWEVLNSSTDIVRAAHIKDGAPTPNYDRFIPNAKFITSHNRFSPPGVEWLYLAIGTNSKHGTELSIAEKCALKECRASIGDHYALCCFRLNDDYKKKNIVDLTIVMDSNYREINNALEQHGVQTYKREVLRGIASGLTTEIVKKPDAKDLIHVIYKWAVYTYACLLTEQIFLPLTTEDREIMYSPFQCMAQYFLSKGYAGIVYSSTVFPAGKNLVLFDKQAAEPYNPIKEITISDNL
jgi:hypothetical protein